MGGAAKAIGGAVAGNAVLGSVGSIYGGVKGVQGLKDLNSTVGNWMTQTAPKVGLGQYKADQYHPNEAAYTDPTQYDARRKALQAQMDAANARTAQAQQVSYQDATPAQLGAAAQMQAAQLDPTQQAQWRAQQQTLAGQLTDQGNGIGPSLAQDQLQQGRDLNIANAMALAASQRGLTAGQGLRQVADQTTNAQQQAAAESARLRLQEQLLARQQLAGVLDTGRTQDIGIANANANYNQQANSMNQDALNQFALTQGNFNQSTNQFNAANQLGASLANQQASQNQQFLNDAMARYFNTGLMTQDAQQQLSAQDLEKLRAQIMGNVNTTNQASYDKGQQRIGDFWSKLGQGGMSALSSMGGSGAGAGALGAAAAG